MLLAAGLLLAACETSSPAGGVANYDALKDAQTACAARGGALVLKNGGDPELLQDYGCKGK
jgi:hypothetical protein